MIDTLELVPESGHGPYGIIVAIIITTIGGTRTKWTYFNPIISGVIDGVSG